MFYHRVLPPPSNPTKAPIAGLRPPNRDTLLENRIMMNENQRTHVDDRGTSHAQQHRPSISDEHTSEADEGVVSPTGYSTRSSARLSRRRDSPDRPSGTNDQLATQRLPSTAIEGPGSGFNDSPSQLCLCQPDPKIPRPRNAFILYRQSLQANVVAQHPGLPNPDISKIIGDSWRNLTEEAKNVWKRAAEEEKIRHQIQYPDYRYQPRRAGRNSVASSTSTDPETQRCLKCGGKAMSMPHNLPTPGVIPTPLSPRASAVHHQQNAISAFNRPPQYIASPPLHNSLGSRSHPGAGPASLASRNATRGHPESLVQMTPDMKRRRIDDPYSQALPRPRNGSVPPPPPQSSRRLSLVRPDVGLRNSNLPMQRGQPSAQAAKSSALALAPLKLDETKESATQAKAVEAMVMSIPAINKIKLLSRISPPLPAPGPASPPHATRGALLAIDGNDEEALTTVVNYLKDYLGRDNEYKVKVFSKPAPTRCETISEWMKLMRGYHQQSEEIIEYITSVPGDTGANASTTATSTRGVSSNTSSPVSPKTIKVPTKQTRGHKKATASTGEDIETEAAEADAEGDPESSIDPSPTTEDSDLPLQAQRAAANTGGLLFPYRPEKYPLPIALVPKYQLTLTDAAASTIPIADEYSPTDHWQWMATLWRGVVGPDVTVDVRVWHGAEPLSQGGPNGGSPAGSGDGGSGSRASDVGGPAAASGSGGKAGPGNPLAVDVKLHEARAVLLRGEPGGKVSDKGLRRMGFEVGEWLRFVGEKERSGVFR